VKPGKIFCSTMPKSCAVFGCNATPVTEPSRSFHQFPKDGKLREAWIKRVRRDNFAPSHSSYICSYHFDEDDFSKVSTDRPSEFQKRTLKRGSLPRWNLRGEDNDQRMPTRFTNAAQRARSPFEPATAISEQESQDMEIATSVEIEYSDTDEKSNLVAELARATGELNIIVQENALLKQKLFSYANLSKEELKRYTGLDKTNFDAVTRTIGRFEPLTYWSGKSVSSITSSDQLLIFIMKLRLDLPYFDLAKRYSVSHTTIQNVFLTYLHVFHEIFFQGYMDSVPSLEKNKCSMPNSFEELSNCRIIIDCTEFLIETPRKDLEAAAASYSNYKSRLTAKFLIAVAPNGSITFVSEGFPGSTSDKVVTDQSKIISHLKVS